MPRGRTPYGRMLSGSTRGSVFQSWTGHADSTTFGILFNPSPAHDVPMDILESALNSAAQTVVCQTIALPISRDAFGDGTQAARIEIIPPLTAGGVLPTRDGRVQRVSDMAVLAAAIAAQSVQARVDFDHQSERTRLPSGARRPRRGGCRVPR